MDLETLAGTAAETAAMSARYPGIASAIEGERTARMVWSGIAEPGERLAGRLVMEMGPRDALKWALLEFSPPLGSDGEVLSPQMNASQESESPETPRMAPGVTAACSEARKSAMKRCFSSIGCLDILNPTSSWYWNIRIYPKGKQKRDCGARKSH